VTLVVTLLSQKSYMACLMEQLLCLLQGFYHILFIYQLFSIYKPVVIIMVNVNKEKRM